MAIRPNGDQSITSELRQFIRLRGANSFLSFKGWPSLRREATVKMTELLPLKVNPLTLYDHCCET